MVDNRGIGPLSNIGFHADNASANKMSEEKQGQGGEYFAQEMQEEDSQELRQSDYQDRSAQLRASLDSLAMVNVGSIRLMKSLKEKEEENRKNKNRTADTQEKNDEELLEE